MAFGGRDLAAPGFGRRWSDFGRRFAGEPELRPPRLRLTGRVGLARGAAVAALLAAAAGTLYVGAPARCPGSAPAASAPDPRSPSAATAASTAAGRPATVSATADPLTAVGPVDGPPLAGPPTGDRLGSGSGRAALPSGTVGVGVTLADPAVLGLLRAGDRVDLLAVPATGAPATLAENATVLVTPTDAGAAALQLAVRPGPARAVLAQPATARFAVLVRP